MTLPEFHMIASLVMGSEILSCFNEYSFFPFKRKGRRAQASFAVLEAGINTPSVSHVVGVGLLKKDRESVTLSWYWPTFCELAKKAGTRFHGIMTNLHFPPQNLLCSDPRYICIFPLCCHIGLSECKLLRRPKASYRSRRTRHNKGLSCNLQVCCISEIGWRNNASVTQGTYIYLCNLYALLNGNHNYFTLRLHNSSISPAYKPSLE